MILFKLSKRILSAEIAWHTTSVSNSTSAMQRRATDFIQSKIAMNAYAGAVGILSVKNQTIFETCLGTLGAGISSSLSLDSLFSMESVSKVICTAPLVLSLSEEGGLQLDQPISTWVKEFKTPQKSKITPRQILSHSSGLPDSDEISLDLTHSTSELWKAILNTDPVFEPGTCVHYSDLGYQVLGHVIELITGKKLDQVARDRIWNPLGMQDTQFAPLQCTNERVTANRNVRGCSVDPIDQALGGVVGCDGVFSTVADLLIFGKTMLSQGEYLGKRILTAESVAELISSQTPFAIPNDQIQHDFEYLFKGPKALGWELPGTPFCHGGSLLSSQAFGKVGGTGTFIWIDPEVESVAIYLTNHGQPVPFGREGWMELITSVGSKEFFSMCSEIAREQ